MLRGARDAARRAGGLTDVDGTRRKAPQVVAHRTVMRRRTAVVVVAALASSALATGPGTASGAAARTASRGAIVRLGPAVEVPVGAVGALRLAAVSCAAPTSCLAVGTDAAGDAVVADGSESSGLWRWRSPRALDAGGIGSATLTSISCASTVRCVAVGDDHLGQAVVSAGSLAAGRWRWAALSSLAADATGGGALDAVSCPSPTRCVAVGDDAAARPIFAAGTWTGTSWTWSAATSIPSDASGGGTLRAVSCGSASGCLAVGSDADGVGVATSAQRAGADWSWTTASPVTIGGPPLDSVSCANVAWCVAVGATSTASTASTARRAASGWSWTPAQPLRGSVAAVSCRSEARCIAVGATGTGASGQASYELAGAVGGVAAWSGAHPVPQGPRVAVSLDAASCGAADSCVAIGMSSSATPLAVGSLAPPTQVPGVRGAAEDAGALVAWRPAGFDGGSRIRAYRAEASPGGATCGVAAGGPLRCRLTGLVNGRRYRVTVSADNGIGLGEVGRGAMVVPTPFQPPVASPLTAGLDREVAGRADVASITVCDLLTGQIWRYDPSSVQHTASIVKVDILATLLHDEQVAHAPMDAITRELATEMIEDSDNDAAQALYVQVGQAPGLAAFNALVGLTGTTPNWAWGFTDTTSLDQARLVRLFAAPNRILTDASRSFGLGLMRHVVADQDWGVSAGPSPSVRIALKDGWYPTALGDWQVNSIGWVDGAGRDYVLAVLTKDNATMGYGVETIEEVATRVWQALARRHRSSTA